MKKNLATTLGAAALGLALIAATACGGSTEPPPPASEGTPANPPAQSAQPPAPPLEPGQENAQLPPGHPAVGGAPAKAPSGELPAGHPPVSGGMGAGTIVPPPPGSGEGEAGLAWTAPKGWISEPPSSSMRKAQYKVPGPGGDGECAVFYFGPGQGGAPMANAERWAGQFTLADGKPGTQAMKSAETKAGDVTVLTVEVSGSYNGGMTMTMEPAKPMPGYMLLGAIAEGPDANWFFKFTGPEATVKANRAAFEAMVKSLKKGA